MTQWWPCDILCAVMDDDGIEVQLDYSWSEDEEPPAKKMCARQVVWRSPEEQPASEETEDTDHPDSKKSEDVEELPAKKEELEVEDPPAPSSSPVGGNHCPAQGCVYTGEGEARIAHWRGSHLPDILLWLCPMGRCSHRCRDAEALQNHLAGRKHKLPGRTVTSLMSLPPLVELVPNLKYQAPGNVAALASVQDIPADARSFAHKEDLGPQVSGILGNKNRGKILLLTPPSLPSSSEPTTKNIPAATTHDWSALLALPPPPPPPIELKIAEIPLPPPAVPEALPLDEDVRPPTPPGEPEVISPPAPPAGPGDVAPPAPPAGTGEDPPPAPPAGPGDVAPPAPPAGTGEDPPPAPPAGPEDVTSPAPPAGPGVPAPAPPAGPGVPAPAPPAGPGVPAPAPPAEHDDLPPVLEGNQDTLLSSPSATVACPGKGAPNAAAVLVGLLPPPPPPAGTASVHGPPQPHHPLTASALRTQVRRLDVQLDQMQRQRHDLMEAAFYAMKKDVQHLEEENSVLRQRSAFLESQLRGYESRAEYVPDPHQVGQLQRVCSCRSHLLVPAAGRTAVYSMDTRDLALLDVSTRSEELSCDPL